MGREGQPQVQNFNSKEFQNNLCLTIHQHSALGSVSDDSIPEQNFYPSLNYHTLMRGIVRKGGSYICTAMHPVHFFLSMPIDDAVMNAPFVNFEFASCLTCT